MGEPVGAVKEPSSLEGESSWRLTDDINRVFSAPEEDVVYASSIDELKAELEFRYPSPDPRLTMLSVEWNNTIRAFDVPRYRGTDVAEVATLTQLCGKIWAEWAISNSREWLNDPTFAATCTIDGCIVTYDPKKAKKRAASKAKREAGKYVSVAETQTLVSQLNFWIQPFPPFKADPAQPRLDAVERLLGTITVLNAVRGENAHRRTGAFQEYAEKWRVRRPQTEAEWLKVEKLKPFVEWMGTECEQEFEEPVTVEEWGTIDLLARLTAAASVPQEERKEE